MSRKNHQMVGGRLLQTNKRYSQLKERQKEKIGLWMYEATYEFYKEHRDLPKGKAQEEIIRSVYEHIEEAGIWIPFYEVKNRYHSKLNTILKHCKRELQE
ncbi:transposase [Anaerobium acetethylicum]|nr:transposase [Anaerobium acetethylicum]